MIVLCVGNNISQSHGGTQQYLGMNAAKHGKATKTE